MVSKTHCLDVAADAVEPIYLWLALLNDGDAETAQIWNGSEVHPLSEDEEAAASRTKKFREDAEQVICGQ